MNWTGKPARILKNMKLKAIALVTALTGVSFLAQAQSGTQGFADIGAPTVTGGDIGTATHFYIGNLISTGAQSGDFVGLSTQIFGPLNFDVTNPTSLSFGNGTFGSFSSTSIDVLTQSGSSVDIYVLGHYSGGSFGGTSSDSGSASFHMTFNQTPAGTGSISDSAGLSIPPEPVPEPTTLALAALGGASLLLFRRRK